MISIITICYNNPNEFLRTANSVQSLRRVYKFFEWIVVDGSTNSDIKNITRNGFDVDILVSEPDDGISDAWNKGIKLSSGEHIMIVNSGDEVRPESFSQILAALKSGKILFTSTQIFSTNNIELYVYKARPHFLAFGMFVPHMGAIVPKEMYHKFGYYKKSSHSMDYEWFYRNHKQFSFDVNNDIVSSNFYLGGISSKQAVLGFWNDFKIQCHGRSFPLLPFVVFLIKSAKHFLGTFLR